MPVSRFIKSFCWSYRAMANGEEDTKSELGLGKHRNCIQASSWYRRAFFVLLVVNTTSLLFLFRAGGQGEKMAMRLGPSGSPIILEHCKWHPPPTSDFSNGDVVEHNVPTVFQPDMRFEHPEEQEDDPWQTINPRESAWYTIERMESLTGPHSWSRIHRDIQPTRSHWKLSLRNFHVSPTSLPGNVPGILHLIRKTDLEPHRHPFRRPLRC